MTDAPDQRSIRMLEPSIECERRSQTPSVVLVVDDDDDSRTMLKILLEMWQYRVLEAKDGSAAISIAENFCPDLILMDVKMPEVDGFGVTREIRQSAKTKNVPIIFLSGCAEPIYKQKASAVGGDEYLVKPLNFQELEITLDRYISRSRVF